MNHQPSSRRAARALLGPAVFLALGAALAVWLGRADAQERALPALVLAFTAVVGIVWQARILAAWRLQAALDAFAERAIAQERVRDHERRRVRRLLRAEPLTAYQGR